MAKQNRRIRVAVNGYGVIGKRVADAIALQEDMILVGVADVAADWRVRIAERRSYPLFAATSEHARAMKEAGLAIAGTLADLLGEIDIIVDCTPKRLGAKNADAYRRAGVKFIVQGGEKHEVTGHSFVAETSYETAAGRDSTRVVSCNTTSVVRTLTALKRAGLLVRARGTLLRRATDPWESHAGGIMNTLVPEPHIPSHQGPDAQTVDPELDVVTMAVLVPETLGHLHYWVVELTRHAEAEEIVAAFRKSPRIAPIRIADGLPALNTVKEMMADLGRPRDNLYEVAVWTDMLTVRGNEAFYAYMVDNQAIVIPENIDAIRAITRAASADESMARTNASLGIDPSMWAAKWRRGTVHARA